MSLSLKAKQLYRLHFTTALADISDISDYECQVVEHDLHYAIVRQLPLEVVEEFNREFQSTFWILGADIKRIIQQVELEKFDRVVSE